MGSTHLSLHYHVVFSTKERIRSIAPAWRDRLHRFLGGCIRQLEGTPLEVGGFEDHVHLLFGLRATHRLADILREIKSASSSMVHRELGGRLFGWQEGYGGFTVSASGVEAVRAYIRNQEEHHRRRTFEEEYRALLEAHGIEFDERFLW
ncbi:MAG: IS200/IS605 family transposase [Thermoanaerobaculia bacterium]